MEEMVVKEWRRAVYRPLPVCGGSIVVVMLVVWWTRR